jgi:5-(carboxyamino)imidazole ribonucleotide mutase
MCAPTVWAHELPIGEICALFLFKEVENMKKVGIIMGSDSDLPVVRKAADTLDALRIPYEMHIFSAHRTPDEAAAFAADARRNGFGVLIAAAGMAAHLAGALAARTTLPVIGIPCKSSCFDGMDALLSTVQMPGGIPVAAVAVNGAVNAALLSAEILAVGDPELSVALDERRAREAKAVLEKEAALQSGIQQAE